MDDVNISYVKHGFTHSFSAIYDALLCCWSIHMLVLHCKVKNKLYLGEYYEFYRYVRRRIWKMEHLDKKQELLDSLETRYTGRDGFPPAVRKRIPPPNSTVPLFHPP